MRDAKLDFTLKELTFPAEHEDVPGSSSTVELQDKKLVCVEYPGVFSSADRMLATLGGEQKVTKVSGK
uniref:Transcription factor IIIC subunit Tfc1/Sfc1 triple barrel domain-containing protein n=1 Tax=Maylandia zebra TaxID=106582 RepID=A0A3P9CER7_9CICH